MKSKNPKTILLVDDSETNRLLIKHIFDENEFEVLLSPGGKEAFEILKTHKVDLILLDVMMPDMDGFEFLTEIKKHDSLKDIPVVMLTAKTNPASIKKAHESGAKDYIKKPIDIDDINKRIKRTLCMK